jgi:hypothetical protein
MDVTHPVLLRRQAQPVAYFDDDGGSFTGGGGEWVDLDGDSQRGSDETLRYVVAKIGLDYPGGNPSGFTTGIDWLYVDVDGDTARDTAPADGWDESSPSFGEPLLVVEDSDGDGALDQGRVILAGSSCSPRADLTARSTAGAATARDAG